MDNKLTKYKSGSVRELVVMALPLMLASISFHFMLFFDRLILSKFSIEAMNASASVGILLFMFSFLGIGVAGIAEVFAGQYYGAKDYRMVARPIWQMIWLGFFLILPFTLIGFTLDGILLHPSLGEEAKQYFRISMAITFISVINTALAAFYVARGKTIVVTLNTVFSNIINIILAYYFVFGLPGYLEPKGLMGACYATSIAMTIQCLILFIVFLNKNNRETFDTANYKIDWPLFKSCLKIGLPNGVGNLCDVAGWAMITRYNNDLGHQYITISTLAQNFFIVFAFYTDGLMKAIIAIASNAIGARKTETINKTMFSAVKLQLIMTVLIFIPLVIFPEATLSIFITNESDQYLIPLAVGALLGTWLFFVIDGNTCIIGSILLSGGDTKFLMFTNSSFSWIFAVLPTFLLINASSHPSMGWMVIMPFYAATLLVTYYLRFRMGKWKHKLV